MAHRYDVTTYYEVRLQSRAGYSKKKLDAIRREAEETQVPYLDLLRMEADRIWELRRRVL